MQHVTSLFNLFIFLAIEIESKLTYTWQQCIFRKKQFQTQPQKAKTQVRRSYEAVFIEISRNKFKFE